MKILNILAIILFCSTQIFSQGIDIKFTNRTVSADGLTWTYDVEATALASYTGVDDNWQAMNIRADLQLPAGVMVDFGSSSVAINATYTESGGLQESVPGSPTAPYNEEFGLTFSRSSQTDISATPSVLGTVTIVFDDMVNASSDMVDPRDPATFSGSFWNNPDNPTLRRDFALEAASALPIKLQKFAVFKLGDRGVKLGWSTSSEVNGSHFEIERSTNATNWEYIGQVTAAGESTVVQEYDFIDENVGLLRSNTTFYYRLKMFDKDGTFEYSDIRSVTFDVDGVSITTFPNPTSDVIRVNMISDADLGAPDSDAYIMDNTGRILTKKKISSNGITEIDLNELPSGILMLQVLHNNKTYTHKIIKVD